jgi:hypothetical protein
MLDKINLTQKLSLVSEQEPEDRRGAERQHVKVNTGKVVNARTIQRLDWV